MTVIKKTWILTFTCLLLSGCTTLFGLDEIALERELTAKPGEASHLDKLIESSNQIDQEVAQEKPKSDQNPNDISDADLGVPPIKKIETTKLDPKKLDVRDDDQMVKYSGNSNLAPSTDRQYQHMTRKKMEEDSELYSSAGSLWKMDGQTSYLFAENMHRQEGDVTTVKMEGVGLKTIENKVAVVIDLMNMLDQQKKDAEENEKKEAERRAIIAQKKLEKKIRAERIARGEIVVDPLEEQQAQARADEELLLEMRKPASEKKDGKDGKDTKTQAKNEPKEEKVDLKDVESMPAKIVERLPDNLYRVRGQQFLTIRKKPYKVIATALVRAEDYNDNLISSNRLLDAQYDLVHLKRMAE